MSDVFLSYAKEDRARVEKLAAALEREGYSVWWDPTIAPGQTFDEVIEEALAETKCVIVVWSRHSVTSRWVKAEAEDGLSRRVLVPAMLEEVRFPLEFRRIQAASLEDWDGESAHAGYEQLLLSVSKLVGRAPAGGEARGPETAAKKEEESEGKAKQAAKPKKPESKLSRFYPLILGVLAIVALAAVIWVSRGSWQISFEQQPLRIGFLMKGKWTKQEALPTYKALQAQLNKRLQSWNHPYKVAPEIKPFRRPEELIAALKKGEIEIAGELSPYNIFDAERRTGALPFISARYGGDTYRAVFFVSANGAGRNKTLTWDELIERLSQKDSEWAVAVSDRSSTSGYWYPRYALLSQLPGIPSFSQISEEVKTHTDIYENVSKGYKGVIAGVIAEFRFCNPAFGAPAKTRQECLKRFISIARTEPIPNGGFVLRKELHSELVEKNLLPAMQKAWVDSVRALGKSRYIAGDWTNVGYEHYATARKVFELADRDTLRKLAAQKKLLITGAIIIVLVSLVFLWLRRQSSEKSHTR